MIRTRFTPCRHIGFPGTALSAHSTRWSKPHPLTGSACDAPRRVVGRLLGRDANAPKCRRTSRHWSTVVRAAYSPYPFDENDYHRVEFMPEPYGPILVSDDTTENCLRGVLVFRLASEAFVNENSEALEVYVSGDTAMCIYQLVRKEPNQRPVGLDLLWQFLERGQEISKKDWKVLKMAIVELKDDVFFGRLFFGDPETGKVLWDCDCRPSDATWLAMKTGAAMYVHKQVWSGGNSPLNTTAAYQAVRQAEQRQSNLRPAPTSTFPRVERSDRYLEAIQLLKRELEVAVQEEDYATAIKIRDHPYMKLYTRIEAVEREGNVTQAQQLKEELKRMIESNKA